MFGLFKMLLPQVVTWAEETEAKILRDGVPLTASQLEDARKIGVAQPEKVRLLAVPEIPMPDNPVLHSAARVINLITPETTGLTLRYGIYIRDDCKNDRALVFHELVHTLQYERLGGFEPFLHQYLSQCMKIGYPAAPLEQEAIKMTEQLCV
jgi:hypothetical protein